MFCYGLWKKYTNHQAKLGFSKKIVDVYEQAIKVVTYSMIGHVDALHCTCNGEV